MVTGKFNDRNGGDKPLKWDEVLPYLPETRKIIVEEPQVTEETAPPPPPDTIYWPKI